MDKIKPHPVPSPPDVPWKEIGPNDKEFITGKLGLEYPPQHVMENALAYMKGTEELKPHGEGCKDCAPNNDGLSKKRGKPMDQATYDTDEAVDFALQKGDIVEWGSDSGAGAKAYGIVREVDETNQQASVQPLMLGPQDMLVRAGEKALMKDLDVLSASSKKLTESVQWPTKANENAVMGMFLAKDTGEGVKHTVMDLAEGNQLSEEQYAELADFFDQTDDGYGGWTCDYADFQQHGGLEMREWLEEIADLAAGLSPGDPVTFKDKSGQSASGKLVSVKGGIAVVRLNSGGTTTVPVAALSEARSSDMSEEAEDDENPLPMADMGIFDEALHPRGGHGKFVSKGLGGGVHAPSPKASPKGKSLQGGGTSNPHEIQIGDPVHVTSGEHKGKTGHLLDVRGANNDGIVHLGDGNQIRVRKERLQRKSGVSATLSDDEEYDYADFASSGGSNTTSAAKTKNTSLNFDESQIQSALKDAPSGFDTTENRQAVLNIVTHAASTGNFGTDATQGMDAASAAAAKQAAASLIESTGGAVARDANGNPTTVTKSPQGDSTSSGSGSGSSSGSGSGSKGSGSGSGSSTPKGSGSGSGGGSKGSGGGTGGGSGGGSGTGGGKGAGSGTGSGKAATPTGPIDPSHPHAPAGQPNGGQFVKKDGSGNTTDTQGADETLNAALEGLDPALDTPENRAALTDAMKGAVNGDLEGAQGAINKIPEGQRADAVQAMGKGLEKLGYKVNRDSSGVPTSVVKKGNETLNASVIDLASVSSRPWSDFSKSDYSTEQWQRACLAPDADGGKLPVLEPSGAINKNALSAAAGALNGARGGVNLAPDQHAKAKSKLKRLYSQVGMDAPADLASSTTPDFAVGDKVSFTDEDGNTVTGEITELKDEGEDDGSEAVVELDESGEEIEIGLDKLTKANDTGSNLASTMTRKASEIAKGHKIMLGAQPHHVTSVRKRGNRVHIKVRGKSKSYSYNADNPVVIPADSGAAQMSDNPFSDIVNFAADVGMDIAQLPLDLAQAKRVGGNIWEKQILPFQKINYKGRILDFSRKFGEALVNNFNKRPFDQVKVFKVDSENRHNSDPENVRGEVNSLKLKDDGVYATVKTNEQGTKHLKEVDPKVGSSVRVRFNWKRPSDNKYFGPVLEHLALTTLPHVPGLNAFVPADLSLTDLSEEEGGATRVAGGVEDMTALSFEVPGMEGGEDPVEDANANTTTVEKEVSDLSDQEIRDLDLSQFEEGQQEAIRKLMEKADLAEQSFEGWQRERQARHEERVDAFIDESNRRGVAPAVTGIARPILMDMSLMEQTLSVDLSDDGSAAQETNVHDALRDIIKNFPSSVEYGKRGAHDLTEDEGDDDDAVYETVKHMFVEGGE